MGAHVVAAARTYPNPPTSYKSSFCSTCATVSGAAAPPILLRIGWTRWGEASKSETASGSNDASSEENATETASTELAKTSVAKNKRVKKKLRLLASIISPFFFPFLREVQRSGVVEGTRGNDRQQRGEEEGGPQGCQLRMGKLLKKEFLSLKLLLWIP